MSNFDVDNIKKDFPVLDQQVNGKDLIYFDNAATMQKPLSVINTINEYYTQHNSNVHRGLHTLSERATNLYEGARCKIQKFINASKPSNLVFVRGTTEAINLVASSVGQSFKPGDEIIISHMEHHSNIVPWQMICEKTGAILKVIPITDKGEIIFDEFVKLINSNTKFVSIGHVSNAIGTINPIKKIIDKAHEYDIPVLIDGAQAVQHIPVDVQELDCDFYAFSGHKAYGPTGIGVLYGKEQWLDKMPPYQGGGEMIKYVSFDKTQYNDLPHKFEAGTPNIAGAIGFGAAIDYLTEKGLDNIGAYEQELLKYATDKLQSIDGVKIIGQADNKTSVISFVLGDIHAHDVGTFIDHEGIALRAGHHCAMPLMDRFNVMATNRVSIAMYNTAQEIDKLILALNKVKDFFK